MELDLGLLISIFLAFLIYFITRYFTIKEYGEKKKETLFGWVSTTLFEEVYAPLKEHANEVSTVLHPHGEWGKANETYRRDVLLFSIAKFLHCAFKNREIIGSDEFFTQYDPSNRYLSKLLVKIISEFKQICTEPVLADGNLDEGAVIKLQFLATFGKAKNYGVFKSLIVGSFSPYHLQKRSKRGEKFIDFWKEEIDILERIKLLKRAYSGKGYLSTENFVNYSLFVDRIDKTFYENDPSKRWLRAKLYAYCALFHKLFSYELDRMYGYVGGPENFDLNELFYAIEKIFEITESKERVTSRFLDSNPEEKYREICRRYDELYYEEQKEIATTKAIIEGIGKVDPKTLEEVKKIRDVASDRIQKEMREIEKYGFIGTEEEISALCEISSNKNKLFEDTKNSKHSNRTITNNLKQLLEGLRERIEK